MHVNMVKEETLVTDKEWGVSVKLMKDLLFVCLSDTERNVCDWRIMNVLCEADEGQFVWWTDKERNDQCVTLTKNELFMLSCVDRTIGVLCCYEPMNNILCGKGWKALFNYNISEIDCSDGYQHDMFLIYTICFLLLILCQSRYGVVTSAL